LYGAPQPVQVNVPTRTDLRYTTDGAMNVSVIRPLRVMYRGDQYNVTSAMTNATAADLNTSGTAYPTWVTDIYLSYSPSVTERTVQQARQIVNEAGAVTPYEQARAIEGWLRQNITYNETIPQPPTDRDPVDWVLFELREGYCNYYASAMVVMLRSLGIPARMAAGFAQGEWDANEQAFVVRERDAHTWVEVFFPGYGWIEFEPTSAQAPINRGDEAPLSARPTVPPGASSTPTETPEPSPTPTSGAADVPPQPESNLFPTATPTFTPTPTATPVIVPTQPPPLRPQPRGPLSFLLPALAAIFVGLIVLLMVAAVLVFIYWWWEWRGMRGYSPITRAYARLERYLPLLGIRVRAEQTPEERRDVIVSELPAAEPPVSAITRMYMSERYGSPQRRRPADSPQSDMADQAWLATRARIVKRYLRNFVPWLRGK
jgi:hypothetical protein